MGDFDKSLYSLRYNQVTSNIEAFGGGSPQWTLITLNNVDPQQVPITRQINTTAPLQGGGNLTADRTLSIPPATGSVDGYLLAADWTTFNNKLTSVLTSANIFVGNGSNIATGVAVTGDVTLSNAGVVALMPVNANVGSFVNANITVDAKGRITAAASGSDTGITQLTGDVTAGPGSGSQATTLATVNGNVGTFTYATLTANAKGLITAVSSGTAPVTSVSGTAGDISSTGGTTPVLDLVNTAVTPGSYTYTALTVDSKGRLTTVSSGTAPVTSVSGTANNISSTGGTTPVIDLVSTTVTPGSYTYTALTVDAKGRLTAASSGTAPVTSVSGTTNQITSSGGTTPTLAIANPLTLPGAMTAGGAIAMAANKITGLANGTAATDAAAFGQIPTVTSWTNYTPTVTGLGTPSVSNWYWKQIGDTIFIRGIAVCGTTTAAAISVTVPTAINNTKTGVGATGVSALLGQARVELVAAGPTGQATTNMMNVFYDGSDTAKFYVSVATGGQVMVKLLGNTFTNNDVLTFDLSYPIA